MKSMGAILAVVALLGFFVFNVGSSENFSPERSPSSAVDAIKTEEFVHLERINLFDFGQNRFFLISNHRSSSQILISNDFPQKGEPLELSFKCDKPFLTGFSTIFKSTQFKNEIRGKQKVAETIFKLKSGDKTSFVLGPQVDRCELTYGRSSQFAKIEMRKETSAFPWLSRFLEYRESCEKDASGAVAGSPIDHLFLNQSLPQLTCAHQMGQIEILDTPEKGFLAKIEMLLGRKLDSAFLSQQNPYAELDFSKAPQFDAIFLSTLVYRADFYGTMMARVLKYHADHGTLVHVVTTKYMMLAKDTQLLHRVASESGNFRLQEFEYYDPGSVLTRPLRYIDSRFRDMHVKMLVTLSRSNPKLNSIVFGGRNIHDGFLFKTKPDYSRYPELVQYGVDDDFVHWNDLEVKIDAPELTRVVYSHLLNFWNRDSYTQKIEDFVASSDAQVIPRLSPRFLQVQGYVREFISVPYEDGHSLEDLYISLVDGAEKVINISSPYLRPTDKILAAINRAIDRHVEVNIQTRVNLTGDTQAWLYEEVNKASINTLFKRAKIYEWTENSILHSKFILIDNKVGFVGSVNLSRRSFVQDIENGFIIRDEKFVQQLDQIFRSYVARSKLITETKQRKLFPSLMIKVLQDQF